MKSFIVVAIAMLMIYAADVTEASMRRKMSGAYSSTGVQTNPPCAYTCKWTPPFQSEITECYNPSVHNCVDDAALPGQKCLCPVGTVCCNKNCYAPSVGSCVGNTGVGGNQKRFCAAGPTGLSCNDICYSPSIFTCANNIGTPGTWCLCQTGFRCCGGACYNPGNPFKCCIINGKPTLTPGNCPV
jgi:hypothetical protein